METIEILCPSCQSSHTKKHCKSPTCGWFICTPCTSKLNQRVFTFDGKKRTMKGWP